MTDLDTGDRRRHIRCTVFELCRVKVEGQEYEGAVVDLSMGGAVFKMDVHLPLQPPVGTPVSLYIERVGRIPAKVVRPLVGGIAVEFRIDQYHEQVVIALKQVLDDYLTEDS
jgi:hypothetical protein